MEKITQGNWHSNEGQIYPTETGKTLALIPYFDKDNEEHQANQKLIAAAPDLLKALINCEIQLKLAQARLSTSKEDDNKAYQYARARCEAQEAINKALNY